MKERTVKEAEEPSLVETVCSTMTSCPLGPVSNPIEPSEQPAELSYRRQKTSENIEIVSQWSEPSESSIVV